MAAMLALMIAGLILAGVGAQWFAWRAGIPAIVVLSVLGLVLGPGTGLLDPVTDFGPLLPPLISIAVAVILFEGGLALDFRELRQSVSGILRLTTFAPLLAWLLGATAAHYLAGLSWPVAALFGGIMIVTGPTVIAPLLRHARLSKHPGTLLKWEGIVNDPIGALFAVLAYEVIVAVERGNGLGGVIGHLAFTILIAIVIGLAAGFMTVQVFRRGWIPEFLKAPLVLGVLLTSFAGANFVQDETGLLAVTVLGLVIGNAHLMAIDEIRRFKETLTVILVSSVFIILTAILKWSMIEELTWGHGLFVLAMLFIVRPVSILGALSFSKIAWRERLLVSWIAPRGIVAVAVSGLFGRELVHLGHEDGKLLIPLAFAMVFSTVLLHGFSIRPLARHLDLALKGPPGVLIVGAHQWTIDLATRLHELEIPVVITDSRWHALRPAREAGLTTFYGEVLSEVFEHHLDTTGLGKLIAATDNDAYNTLVCTDFAPEFGRRSVFQTGLHRGPDDRSRHKASQTLGGLQLFSNPLTTDDIRRDYRNGVSVRQTRLTDEFGWDAFTDLHDESPTILAMVRGNQLFIGPDIPKAKSRDVILYLGKTETEAA
ncbi:cation:proton antiporter [Thalassospira sp. SM2505]|uniref:cation:proton antiporter n=1 Tax=Thalassospira profundimaris TaxID=502049 RepID=UPI000DEDF24E|nr:sodium:proton antiporter [Thalassospira profundimaris]